MSIIELKDITKKYKGGKTIFSNYSLKIGEGEFVGIVGESGAGKTTLLNIIGLISNISSGSITIKKQSNLTPSSKKAMLLRRNTIGYLFQNYGLIDDESVEWNLNLALEYKKLSRSQRKEKIQTSLIKIGLTDYEKKKIYQLSGGEQQRVAIAKLFLQESSIILADEPTSGLDNANKIMVMDLLKELNNKGITVIMVTHDLEIAKQCGRIIEIADGNII